MRATGYLLTSFQVITTISPTLCKLQRWDQH